MTKENRFLKAETQEFDAKLSSVDEGVSFILTIAVIGLGAWFFGQYCAGAVGAPPYFSALCAFLAPILYVGWLTAKSRLSIIEALEEEATEAVETAAEYQQKASESIEKAQDYDRLQSDNSRLTKELDRCKIDNDRLWQKQRALEDELTAVNAKATADIEEVKKLALNSSTLLRNQVDNTKNRLSAIETGLKIAGEIGSLNGRCAKATGDEKAELDRLKQEQQALMQQHLQKNIWLFELMPSWGGIKQK